MRKLSDGVTVILATLCILEIAAGAIFAIIYNGNIYFILLISPGMLGLGLLWFNRNKEETK